MADPTGRFPGLWRWSPTSSAAPFPGQVTGCLRIPTKQGRGAGMGKRVSLSPGSAVSGAAAGDFPPAKILPEALEAEATHTPQPS